MHAHTNWCTHSHRLRLSHKSCTAGEIGWHSNHSRSNRPKTQFLAVMFSLYFDFMHTKKPTQKTAKYYQRKILQDNQHIQFYKRTTRDGSTMVVQNHWRGKAAKPIISHLVNRKLAQTCIAHLTQTTKYIITTWEPWKHKDKISKVCTTSGRIQESKIRRAFGSYRAHNPLKRAHVCMSLQTESRRI